ncbi:MAG: FAD-binding oxidoreductase [Raineya sp.]|jgi:glycine/D-amino acid oxidase-like deaminating enzyme|nr:FAD-binding oxidoreductase [Raineya sp.]
MKNYDYIVVGQGIAGTVFSYILLQNHKTVLVIGSKQKKTSSLVAGGIFNPLTGKGLVKTWKADELFPFMKDFYENLEKDLKTSFFHQMPIYRPYRSIQEQNDWLGKTANPDFGIYVESDTNDKHYTSDIYNDLGGLETKYSGWVDLPKLLEAYRCFIQEKESYLEEDFDYSALEIKDKLYYKGVVASKIIFCEGTEAIKNPYFTNLPFSLVKGETIDILIKDATFQSIVNQGVSIIPLGNQVYRVASTYSWNPLDWENTEKAKEELIEKARNLLKRNFEVVGQKAGIRPATKHRRPIVGMHPQYPHIGIFNGLGSKGVSLAPYLAKHFFEHIEYKALLDKDLIQPQ